MTIPRGTTPSLRFRLPDTSSWVWQDASYIRVDFSVNGIYVLTKETPDLEYEERILTCRMEQQETLSWPDDAIVEIEVCVKFGDGNIMKSAHIREEAGRILNETEL